MLEIKKGDLQDLAGILFSRAIQFIDWQNRAHTGKLSREDWGGVIVTKNGGLMAYSLSGTSSVWRRGVPEKAVEDGIDIVKAECLVRECEQYYREVCAHEYKNEIYINDNIIASLEEINEPEAVALRIKLEERMRRAMKEQDDQQKLKDECVLKQKKKLVEFYEFFGMESQVDEYRRGVQLLEDKGREEC